jgi:predicted phage-related endonuclease
MGENRFKSAGELLHEKRGPALDFGQNAARARGTELEPEARRRYVAKTGRDVRPICLQSTRYDWLRVSLDGFANKQQEAWRGLKLVEAEVLAA